MVYLNRNIRKTVPLLVCGFSLIIGLMVAIAYQGLSQLERSKSYIHDISHVHHEKDTLIGKMQRLNREQIISLQHMLITDDVFDLDDAARQNVEIAQAFVQARKQLEALPNEPAEQALLADMKRYASEAAPYNDRVRDMLLNNEIDASDSAEAILLTQLIPVQNKISGVFDALVELHGVTNGQAIQISENEYDYSRSFIIQMLQVAVILAILTGVWVTRHILRNERALKENRDELELLVSKRTSALESSSSEAIIARREAEHANRAKSTFMANMSHELRTPLNAVLGFSEIMDLQVMGPLSTKYREYATHINTSAKHLLELIEQLLDLSRIEAGRLELSESDVCFSSILNETITVVRSAFQRETYKIFLTPDSVSVRLRGDERLLKQTLINIISNAAKYSDPDDPVELTLRVVDGKAVLNIRDRGIGIAPEEIPRLFNPYERSEAQTAREHQGTGLGLTIARSLIEAHGGSLTLDSELGVGTEVTITLPAERVLLVKQINLPEVASA